MNEKKNSKLVIFGVFLVLAMAFLQGFYAIYAYLDPTAFAVLRGTELVSAGDVDWVKIYASRTMFVSLIIGYLLYRRNYEALMWAALFGTIMPTIDGLLAHGAQAPTTVFLKHMATVVYLLVTFAVLRLIVVNRANT